MSCPGLIDTREFARLSLECEGRSPLASFKRLASMLCDTGGELNYRLRGSLDEHGKAAIELEIDVDVRVVCQRCLGELELPLRVRNRLRLIDQAPEWTAEAAEFESNAEDEIVSSPALDVQALVEDEVMLALPLAPRHEHCELAHGEGGRGGPGEMARESPFGVLARLKNRAN